MLAYVNVTWVLLILIVKPYKISRVTNTFRVVLNHWIIIVFHLFLLLGYYVIQIEHQYSRELLTLFYGSLVIGISVWKIAFSRLLFWYRSKGYNYRNIIVVHQENIESGIDSYMKSNAHLGYRICKEFYANDANIEMINQQMKLYCKSNKVDEIFYSINSLQYGKMIDLIRFSEENFIKFKLMADFKGFMFRGIEVQNFGALPVLNIVRMPLEHFQNRLIKRTFDVLFSLLVIVGILSWLLPILMLLIKLDSKGSVLFKQKRTGKEGKAFWCFKLRSMQQNENSDIQQAAKNDYRITRIGKILRATSLDELPQFFNVLVGNMSIVGPRPHMLNHTKQFDDELDQFMVRHSVKPGITGLAQTKGYRGETSTYEERKNRVKLDRFYVTNWSFYFDSVIIFDTIIGLFKNQAKAY